VTATAPARPQIVILVAAAENGVIGRGNTIPWKLKADQQRLKAMTMGKPIVMGRKTFESLRRPLPGRTNIVITRDANYRAPGAIVTNSFENALVSATSRKKNGSCVKSASPLASRQDRTSPASYFHPMGNACLLSLCRRLPARRTP